jgi:hypothetical protein
MEHDFLSLSPPLSAAAIGRLVSNIAVGNAPTVANSNNATATKRDIKTRVPA